MRPTRNRPAKAARRQALHRDHAPKGGPLRLFGHHAVQAALANPARYLHRLVTAAQSQADYAPLAAARKIDHLVDSSERLSTMLGPGSVHQGVMLETEPLDPPALEDVLPLLAPGAPLLMLDQVTDPHNLGAILRTAAAFNACALVTQDRHSPPETGALAKAASGALELVPWVRVTNLARALEMIGEAGGWRIGLEGTASATLAQALPQTPVCLVLGSEGAGLRPNVAAHCDALARLPISARMESLNVSNAAAIALYEATRTSLA